MDTPPASEPRPAGWAWQLVGLAAWLLVTAAAALVGAVASMNAGEFYHQLRQPAWAPPAGLFSPVWTVLYLMMATAAWLVWRDHGWTAARGALWLYLAQLVLNALWSWLFFAWQDGMAALLELVLLWVAIAATLAAFWRLHRAAGLLLVPYLAWVTYAGALNYTLWMWNPERLG